MSSGIFRLHGFPGHLLFLVDRGPARGFYRRFRWVSYLVNPQPYFLSPQLHLRGHVAQRWQHVKFWQAACHTLFQSALAWRIPWLSGPIVGVQAQCAYTSVCFNKTTVRCLPSTVPHVQEDGDCPQASDGTRKQNGVALIEIANCVLFWNRAPLPGASPERGWESVIFQVWWRSALYNKNC